MREGENGTMLEERPDPLALELLVLPETTLIEVAAVIEPLRAANRLAARPLYAWTIPTPDGAPATTEAGVPVPAARAFRGEGTAPLLVLASFNVAAHGDPGLIARLSRAGSARPAVVGVEAGAWLMARAGLLDGRRATTHWEDLEAFAAAHPAIAVVPERFVIDGARMTTGGAGPALDLMLEVIRRRQGYGLMLEVAKAFIYEPPAAEGQGPALAFARPRDPHLARAVALMEAHLAEPLPVERIAREAGVSPRHLRDLFRDAFGVAPHDHYLALRLTLARRLLVETARPVLEVAAAAGFASASGFARAYRRLHGESPRATRRQGRRR